MNHRIKLLLLLCVFALFLPVTLQAQADFVHVAGTWAETTNRRSDHKISITQSTDGRILKITGNRYDFTDIYEWRNGGSWACDNPSGDGGSAFGQLDWNMSIRCRSGWGFGSNWTEGPFPYHCNFSFSASSEESANYQLTGTYTGTGTPAPTGYAIAFADSHSNLVRISRGTLVGDILVSVSASPTAVIVGDGTGGTGVSVITTEPASVRLSITDPNNTVVFSEFVTTSIPSFGKYEFSMPWVATPSSLEGTYNVSASKDGVVKTAEFTVTKQQVLLVKAEPELLLVDNNGSSSGISFLATTLAQGIVQFYIETADNTRVYIGATDTIQLLSNEHVATLHWTPSFDLETGNYKIIATIDPSSKSNQFSVMAVPVDIIGVGFPLGEAKDPVGAITQEPKPVECPSVEWNQIAAKKTGHLGAISVSDPVNIVSGNFFLSAQDLSLKAKVPVVLARIYNSLDITDRAFGKGWSSSFFAHLKFQNDDVAFYNSDGSRILFNLSGNEYVTSNKYDITLNHSDDTGFWVISTPKGETWTFSHDGKILRMEKVCCGAGAQDALEYQYATNGNLLKVSNAIGQWLSFEFTGNYVTKITDSASRSVNYSYDATGHLIRVIDALGRITNYAYDDNNFLTEIIKPGNKKTSIEYENKRVKQIINPDSTVNSFVWDLISRQTTLTDANGIDYVYGFNQDWAFSSYSVPTLGITKTFNSSGSALIETTNSLGDNYQYEYDSNNFLNKTTDSSGFTKTYEYHTTLHKLTKKSDALDRTWQYDWCTRGNLMSKTDPAGNNTAYTYDSHNNRTSITDPMGRVTKYIYDDSGSYLLQTIDPASGTVTFTYDNRGNLLTTTDAINRVTTFEYDILDRLTKTIYPDGRHVVIAYNEAGNIVSRTDNVGRATQYTYDLADRLLVTTYPDSTTLTHTYDAAGRKTSSTDALGRITSYEYDAIGNLTKTIYPDNTYKAYTYDTEKRLVSKTDELGNTTSFEYDPMGRLLASIDPAGSRWENQYDVAGRKITDKDPIGRNTQYVYDVLNQVVKTVYPDFSENTFVYDNVGNQVLYTDALGKNTAYTYDNLNRNTGITEANGANTTTVFNAVSQVITETNPLGAVTSYAYDLAGRVITTTDALGEQWNYEYDNSGRMIKAIDPLNASYTVTYDAMDRVTTQTNANGAKTQLEYDAVGRNISTTDSLGGRALTAYDLRNRVISQVDPEGRIVSFGYDAVGNKTRLTEGAGRTHVYEFDNLGRKTAEVDPLGNRTTYAYDSVSNMVTKTNARGQITEYAYTTMNLLDKVTYPDTTIATFSYDINDRELSRSSASGSAVKTWDNVGNLLSETFQPANKGWNYEYDLAGNRIKGISPERKTVLYNYDALSRLVQLKASKYDSISYKYDANSRLSEIIRPRVKTAYQYDNNSNVLKIEHSKSKRRNKLIAKREYSYDLNGNRLDVTNEDNKKTQYAYDRANWLNHVVYPNGQIFDYAYNGAGDRLSETIQTPVQHKRRRRGKRHHRKKPCVTTPEVETETVDYAYDAAGRMIARGSDFYEYDTDSNLVRDIESGQETIYNWNSDNRLTKVEKTLSDRHFTRTATEEYEYLPEDWRRLVRTSYTSFKCNWGRRRHQATTIKNKYLSVYDNQDESHEYWQSPSFMRRAWRWGRHCWKPKTPKLLLQGECISGPYSDDIEISKYKRNGLYMLKDALGSTIALANRGGKAIAKIGYDAWGNFRYENNKNICRPFNSDRLPSFLNRLAHTRGFGKSSHNAWAMGKYFATHMSPYLYAGRKYNQFTRQYFNRNRYYQPKYGRFTSKDPIGFNGDINLYRYAGDNPLTFVDPWGLKLNMRQDPNNPCSYIVYDDENAGQDLYSITGSSITDHKRSFATRDGVLAGKYTSELGDVINQEALRIAIGNYLFTKYGVGHGTKIRTQPRTTQPINSKPPKLNVGRQGKHQVGHNNYKAEIGKSVLTADPNELLSKAGTGQRIGNKVFGEAGFKERVGFGRVIGEFKTGPNSVGVPTTKGIIHYDAKGTVHIVPCAP